MMTPIHASKEIIYLGDASVTLDWHDNGDPLYVHLHENETTAWQAVRLHTNQYGGSYLHIHQSGQRNVCFRLDKKRYCFDPNRIFTDAGIKQTLSTNSPIYHPDAHREIDKLSQRLKEIMTNRSVIAVHNNQAYSMRDYMAKHSLATEAQALHWHNFHDYRDFLLTTQRELWSKIKQSNHNVVLQSRQTQDDGSLSIWMAKQAYINCEAGYGHLKKQLSQLKLANKLMAIYPSLMEMRT